MSDLFAHFAIEDRDGQRRFVHAPPDLWSLIATARRFGSATLVVEGDERFSYDEIFARADALAAAMGVTPGDRVAIAMRNRAEWIIAFLAIIRAGGVAVLLNSRGSPAEMMAAVQECGPALVLADRHRREVLQAGGYAGRLIATADFPASDAVARPPVVRQPEDPAVIMFTSGTSGRVKGAVLSHRNMVHALMGIQRSGLMILATMAERMGVAPEALIANAPPMGVLLVYPLFHISGIGSGFLSTLLAGGKIVIMRRWDVETAFQLVEAEKLTNIGTVPTMLWDILQHPALGNYDLTSIRSVGIGGQAVPRNLLDAARKALPHAVFGTGYGQTETSGVYAMIMGEEFDAHPGTSGRVSDLIEARVIGVDGAELTPGHVGELCARGPVVMQGYWNNPDDTAATLDADGWLKTGDIGMIDSNGYVTVVDRKKDMVISGGENIYCAEVERVISQLPEAHEFAAFGIPDERLGELLVAVVAGDNIDEQQVIDHVAEHLARYKAPGRVAVVPGPLPRNLMDKVDKVALRQLWPQLIGDE